MKARKSIVVQWNYILLAVHYSVLVMLNARLWDFSFLGWLLLNLFASLLLYLVEILLVHPKSLNPVLPYESTIPTYMWYFRAVLSKFVCANSNFQNELPFCVPVPLMKRERWPIFFHARCVIPRWVFIHLSLHESVVVIGMPSPEMKKKFILGCQIINSLENVGMEGTRGYS